MLIVCPSCATSYNVGLASLSPNGRQVRCARCRTVWHAELSHSEKLVAAAAAIAPHNEAPHNDVAEQVLGSAESAGSSRSEPVETADAISGEAAAPAGVDLPAIDDNDSATSTEAESGSANAEGVAAEVQAPPIVPADAEDGGPPIDVTAGHSVGQTLAPAEDVETVAARRLRHDAKRRMPRWPLSEMQTGVLALALINIILVGWRADVVRAQPQTASFYALLGLPVNLRGLAFNDVVTSVEQHEGVPILVVEGNIVNSTHKVAGVPRLKFMVRNAAHQEIYSWTAVPSRNVLPPGEAVSFRARLASPPLDAHDLVVRFMTRHDFISGTH